MKTALTLACVLAVFSPATLADTLLIERVGAEQGKPLPRRGSSMAQVQAQFGEPQARHAPVGGGSRKTPPITRWQYADFSVYFENSHVVDAVLVKASELEIGPAAAGS